MTFQSPLSALHRTCLVMGHTNSVQTMHILWEEIPLFTMPFIDDVAIKGPVTCYENADSTYETIPKLRYRPLCLGTPRQRQLNFTTAQRCQRYILWEEAQTLCPNHCYPRAAVQLWRPCPPWNQNAENSGLADTDRCHQCLWLSWHLWTHINIYKRFS
jgi:hypothetical protein